MTHTWLTVVEDALSRVDESLTATLEGLDPDDLARRPGPDANPVGWLAWHLTRVLDGHLADLVGAPQVWEEWRVRLDLPYDAGATGYGQSSAEVGAFRADAASLTGYWAATWHRTREVLRQLAGEDAERVVDDSWDPPVTVSSRLVSVVNDVTQHVGQMGYARGLLGA
ncbi:mycothiol transferase [uncultured Nocardioides sp.]|uniref:mycothiol transferase n=1 Tax=uncultured Nocardioides sp. TaxID=198441 RepID=UPI0025D63DC5|nr:DUF664 domain-containing protein [uncultured Nocardioides sp.]